MLFNSAIGPILCQAFPFFLEENLHFFWFSTLFAGLIHDYVKLFEWFINHFSSSHFHHIYLKTLASLACIKQGPTEPLEDYLTHFNKEALQIRKLSPNVALHSMVIRLKLGLFVESLVIKPVKDLEEF